MENRYGVRGTTTDGVFFTEDAIANAPAVKRVSVEISRQNSDITEIKRRMAQEAKAAGANAIMSFRYGQRKHEWWQLLALKWDTESWYGEGVAVTVRDEAV